MNDLRHRSQKTKNSAIPRMPNSLIQQLNNGLRFDPVAGVTLAPPAMIEGDRNQPRQHFDLDDLRELKRDIEDWRAKGRGIAGTGYIQPILGRWEPGAVKPDGSIKKGAKIIIVEGEKRWRSAWKNADPRTKVAEAELVPVVLDDVNAKEARDVALRSSIHRKDLLPEEEAAAFAAKMEDEGMSLRVLARHFNKSTGYIENRLALLKMRPDVREMVAQQPKTLSSARLINKVQNEKVRQGLIDSVLNDDAPYAEIKDRVEPFITRDSNKGRKPAQMPRIDIPAYFTSIVNNTREVRDALKATKMPKEYYRSKVNPHVKELENLLAQIKEDAAEMAE